VTEFELDPPVIEQPKQLSGGWRMSSPYVEQKQKALMDRMVREIMDGPRPPPRIIPTHFEGKLIADLSAKEMEQFHLSMQTEATRAAILAQGSRRPEDDLEHSLRPIPKEYLANPEAETVFDLIGTRKLDHEQAGHYQQWRKTQKNTIGTSDLSAFTKARREKAAQAFTYSPPASPSLEDLRRLKKLKGIDAVQPSGEKDAEAPKEKRHWFPAFWGKFWNWQAGYGWKD
jgi:hypothetical protein